MRERESQPAMLEDWSWTRDYDFKVLFQCFIRGAQAARLGRIRNPYTMRGELYRANARYWDLGHDWALEHGRRRPSERMVRALLSTADE